MSKDTEHRGARAFADVVPSLPDESLEESLEINISLQKHAQRVLTAFFRLKAVGREALTIDEQRLTQIDGNMLEAWRDESAQEDMTQTMEQAWQEVQDAAGIKIAALLAEIVRRKAKAFKTQVTQEEALPVQQEERIRHEQ